MTLEGAEGNCIEYSQFSELFSIFIFTEPKREGRLGQCSEYSDSLRDGRSGDRIPVGTSSSLPFQRFPEAHPASCIVGFGSYAGVAAEIRY